MDKCNDDYLKLDMLRGSRSGVVFYGVDIGEMNNYPHDGSTVYYCPDDDMLYLYPVEDIGEKRRGEARRVFEWYTFSDILKLDSEDVVQRSKVSRS
jgi:hypothetical protein